MFAAGMALCAGLAACGSLPAPSPRATLYGTPVAEAAPCPRPAISPSVGVAVEPFSLPWINLVSDQSLRHEIVAIEAPEPDRRPPTVDVRVRDLGASEPRVRSTSLLAEPAQYAAIERALSGGARVVVGSLIEQSSPSVLAVNLVIIQPKDGQPFFAGQCAERDLTHNLEKAFGDAYADAVERLTLGPIALPAAPDRPVTFLLPGDAPDELLASLKHVTVQLVLPKAWAGERLNDNYVVTTHIGAGWNEALPLNWENPDPTSTRIGAYLPMSGTVDLVILGGDGDVTKQVRVLGHLNAVDLVTIAERGERDERGVAAIVVEADGTAQQVIDADIPVRLRATSP